MPNILLRFDDYDVQLIHGKVLGDDWLEEPGSYSSSCGIMLNIKKWIALTWMNGRQLMRSTLSGWNGP